MKAFAASPMMAIPDSCRLVLNRLTEHGFCAYAVGGCVRDSLLGLAPHDWDITTDALPETVLALFPDYPVLKTGLKHGTVTVLVDHEPYEVTTFRIDGTYSDGRRPDSVRFSASVRDDLARRDFTVNAMAYNDTEGLIDPFGGQQDLKAGLIRCVGDPYRRFSEDALRLLRAVRFAAVLGFSIEPETLSALHARSGTISVVARERIFSELKKILAAPHAAEALREAPDLLFAAVPQLACLHGVPQNNRYHCCDVFEHTLRALGNAPADCTVRLAVLLHDTGKAACRTTDANGFDHFYGHAVKSAEIARKALCALRCDNKTLQNVVTLVGLHDTVFPMRPVKFRRLIAAIGFDLFDKLLDVCRADCAAHAPDVTAPRMAALDGSRREADRLRAENFCLSLRQLAINGDDLYALGLRGPEIGGMLNRLLDSVICGQLPNDRERLLRSAERSVKAKTE
ncbi:MAG: CCA tRNA nucleotidyltransferase [Hominenteromicrobium sp.]